MMYYFFPRPGRARCVPPPLVCRSLLGLIFTYMWAGPHHLHYTALRTGHNPVGILFSLILAPLPAGRHDQQHHDAVGRMAQAACDDPILRS